MDPIRNPYAPGAGTQPPELAGRDEIRETARIALERVRIGRSSKSLLLVGRRGVGKTVLLDRIKQDNTPELLDGRLQHLGPVEWVGTGRKRTHPSLHCSFRPLTLTSTNG